MNGKSTKEVKHVVLACALQELGSFGRCARHDVQISSCRVVLSYLVEARDDAVVKDVERKLAGDVVGRKATGLG